MAKKIKRLFWNLPRVWIHRDWGSRRFVIVDFDMYVIVESLTEAATKRLAEFMAEYFRVHKARLKRADWWVGRNGGVIQVLPEHADEFAARLLMYISDPTNFDPRVREAHDELWGLSDQRQIAAGRPTHDERMQANHREVEAKFPKFVADPLGETPGKKAETVIS